MALLFASPGRGFIGELRAPCKRTSTRQPRPSVRAGLAELTECRGLTSSHNKRNGTTNRTTNRTTKRTRTFLTLCSAETPKGFGKKPAAPPQKKPTPTPTLSAPLPGPAAEARERREEPQDDVIPEIVTNRILRRLAFTVGAPLFLGVGFFPLFYYLKVVQKVDIPDWLPLLCSTSTFGLAGLGISYGVISTSWDPLREGSLLGWKEARANWPVFTQTLTRRQP